MDTFVDSSWYYIRYLDPNNENQLVDQAKINKYLPVDIYIGGIEHAILHLLYSRFIHKFLHSSLHLTNTPEPFACLLTQGMVHSQTFKLSSNGKYVPKSLIQFKGTKIFLFSLQQPGPSLTFVLQVIKRFTLKIQNWKSPSPTKKCQNQN